MIFAIALLLPLVDTGIAIEAVSSSLRKLYPLQNNIIYIPMSFKIFFCLSLVFSRRYKMLQVRFEILQIILRLYLMQILFPFGCLRNGIYSSFLNKIECLKILIPFPPKEIQVRYLRTIHQELYLMNECSKAILKELYIII